MTQDHESYGACLRGANIQIDQYALRTGGNVEKDKEKRLDRYESARRQGLQPKTTGWADVRAAFETGGVPKTKIEVT